MNSIKRFLTYLMYLFKKSLLHSRFILLHELVRIHCPLSEFCLSLLYPLMTSLLEQPSHHQIFDHFYFESSSFDKKNILLPSDSPSQQQSRLTRVFYWLIYCCCCLLHHHYYLKKTIIIIFADHYHTARFLCYYCFIVKHT